MIISLDTDKDAEYWPPLTDRVRIETAQEAAQSLAARLRGGAGRKLRNCPLRVEFIRRPAGPTRRR